MKRAAIITASDSGYRGEREDLSGPAIREILEREGYEVISMDILPDDQVMLAGKLQEIADSEKAELILTTGGTGFSERDVTPEATEEVIERKVPGIPEANSNPVREFSAAMEANRAILMPAPAEITFPSTLVEDIFAPNLTIIPRTPLSFTRMLEPFPIKYTGTEYSFALLTSCTSSCAERGCTIISALPPIFKVV